MRHYYGASGYIPQPERQGDTMDMDEALRIINILNEELTARRISLGDLAHMSHQQTKEIASLKKQLASAIAKDDEMQKSKP